MFNNCTLRVGGKIYGGWKEIEIQRGIEQVTGRFTLSVTERWSGQAEPRPILPGQSCQVYLGDAPVLTGWIGRVVPGRDDKNSWLTIEGRDKTHDLCDCSAIHKSGQWKNSSLAKIAADLLAPFKIETLIGETAKTAANKKIASFNIEEGETVFACLERAARLQALMLWTNGLGQLVISLPDAIRADVTLREGVNLKYMQGEFSHDERFSKYIIKGHTKHDDDEAPHQSKGEATDAVISRYRPLIVLAEDHAGGPTAKQRAQWEAAVRAGRGNRATVKVQGWCLHGDTGKVWQPGMRVAVESPTLRVKGDLLIVACTWKLSAMEGTITEMELADPRAMDQLSGVRSTKLTAAVKGKNGLAVDSRGDHKKSGKSDDWSML